MDDAINIEDLRRMAKRRLPKIAYDFIEGGAEDEVGMARNERSFRDLSIVPRYLVDVSKRDQSATLFGRSYASPVGIAPTGLAALFRPGADMMLAEAARDANIPFIMSGASTASIEDLARVAPEHGWYQLYAAKDKAISEDMIARARVAGLSTLVLTVDVPVSSNRERNRRNGFGRPLKLSLKTKIEALTHPAWMAGFLKHGEPLFSNWAPYAPKGASNADVAALVASQTNAPLTWADVERFRALWPRHFVLKGIMDPRDAIRAAELGVDGIMVSNHGARQIDKGPSPVEVFPAIRDAVGDKMTLMIDSGIRRGSDAVAAMCMGVKFSFVGRATLYGAVAGGKAGAAKALSILRNEIDLTLAQMGAPTLKDLGPDFLFSEDPTRNR